MSKDSLDGSRRKFMRIPAVSIVKIPVDVDVVLDGMIYENPTQADLSPSEQRFTFLFPPGRSC